MSINSNLSSLPHLGLVIFRGEDARSFLQGQLSNDLNLLSPTRALLASGNSAQGRVQFVLTLIQRDADIIALFPRELTATLVKRMKLYVLRSKVTIEDASEALPLYAVMESANDLPTTPGEVAATPDGVVMRWWSHDARYVVIGSSAQATEIASDQWRARDIAAGIPQVVAATYEHFVAQMLNLDVLNGISFNKGCYTGQEIIARTHYRGTVKRRLLRFAITGEMPSAGAKIMNGDQPAGEVVDAIDGELLAVMSLDQLPSEQGALHLEANVQAKLTPLPMPYAVS